MGLPQADCALQVVGVYVCQCDWNSRIHSVNCRPRKGGRVRVCSNYGDCASSHLRGIRIKQHIASYLDSHVHYEFAHEKKCLPERMCFKNRSCPLYSGTLTVTCSICEHLWGQVSQNTVLKCQKCTEQDARHQPVSFPIFPKVIYEIFWWSRDQDDNSPGKSCPEYSSKLVNIWGWSWIPRKRISHWIFFIEQVSRSSRREVCERSLWPARNLSGQLCCCGLHSLVGSRLNINHERSSMNQRENRFSIPGPWKVCM